MASGKGLSDHGSKEGTLEGTGGAVLDRRRASDAASGSAVFGRGGDSCQAPRVGVFLLVPLLIVLPAGMLEKRDMSWAAEGVCEAKGPSSGWEGLNEKDRRPRVSLGVFCTRY
jgi:hypothetical protein